MPPKKYTEEDKGRDIVIVSGTNAGREAWVMEKRTNPVLFKSTKDRVNVILKPTANGPEKASFTNFGSISFLPRGGRNSLMKAMVKKKPKIGQLTNAIVMEMSQINFSPGQHPEAARAALDELFTSMLEYWNQLDASKRQENDLEYEHQANGVATEATKPTGAASAFRPRDTLQTEARAAAPQQRGTVQVADREAVPHTQANSYLRAPPTIPGVDVGVVDPPAQVPNSFPPVPNVIPHRINDETDDQDMWSTSLNSDLSAQINQLSDEIGLVHRIPQQ